MRRGWIENFGGEFKYNTEENRAFWDTDLSVDTDLNMKDVLSYKDPDPMLGGGNGKPKTHAGRDLPDLCHCVHTEAAHPGVPKESATTRMEETEQGPRLAHLQFAGMTRTGATDQRLTTGEL